MAKNNEDFAVQNKLMSVRKPTEIVFYIVLGIFALACILPFIFVVIISFSSEESIRTIGYSFIPTAWSTKAYEKIFELGDQLWRSYFNSFLVTIVGTVISMIMTLMYAYVLSRKDFKHRNFYTIILVITMFFGGGLTPTYIVCTQLLGLSNNYAALIVPALVSPWFVIIMRTFLKGSVPEELIEAAAIDGSGEYHTLLRIIVPLAKPGIATISLMTAINYWNDWFLTMIYVRNAKLFPLQYLLMRNQQQSDFLVKNSSKIGIEVSKIIADLPTASMRMALVVFIVVPIACAYPFFQQYIISGLTIGAVKG